MAETKPPIAVTLAWEGQERFAGTVGDNPVRIDGNAIAGPSPTQLVAVGLAGCMAIDIADIVMKGRHSMTALAVRLDAHRVSTPPARFVRMVMHCTVSGDVSREVVDRAIRLSRDKYCSVWHSLRQDIDFVVTFDVVPSPAPPS